MFSYCVQWCSKSFLSFRTAVRVTQVRNARHSLPELPYNYDALEPIICKEIMELHHKKHHQSYVNNLNAAEEKLNAAVGKNDLQSIISILPVLRFNGGGHVNHSIFWKSLSPHCSKLDGEILELVKQSFGSPDCLQEKLGSAANGIQGSGWAWLGYNSKTGCLQIATTANQDPLLATTGLHPLLGIDVWEHAYYLQYLNARADYTKAIFEVINWSNVQQMYTEAKCNTSGANIEDK